MTINAERSQNVASRNNATDITSLDLRVAALEAAPSGGGYIDPNTDWKGWDGVIKNSTDITGATITASVGKKIIVLEHMISTSMYINNTSNTVATITFAINGGADFTSQIATFKTTSATDGYAVGGSPLKGLKLNSFKVGVSISSNYGHATSNVFYIEVDD